MGKNDYNSINFLYHETKTSASKILFGFYNKKTLALLRTCIFLTFQRSPVWVIPVVTSNIIDIATNKPDCSVPLLVFNTSIALLFLLQNIASTYLATQSFSKINRGIEESLRNTMIFKLQHLSITFHKEMQSGKLQSKVMRDVENIYTLLSQFNNFYFFATDLLIISVIIFLKSPLVLFFFMIVIPIAAAMIYAFRKPMGKGNQNFRSEMEETQGAVAEMLELIPITRAHGLQDWEIQKMHHHIDKICDSGHKLDLINALFASSGWVLFQVLQLLCLSFSAFLALQEKISIGEVVLYQTYFTQLLGQISNILNIYPQISKGIESVHSIGDILGETDEEPNHAIIPLGTLKGKVIFDHISFRYPDSEHYLLRDFCLQVMPGESVAFVGESGSGKSTILNMLIGFLTPEAGRILIDDIHIKNLNMLEYRSQIAVVPQTSIIFSGTIRENIIYGLNNISDNEIMEVLKKVGLDDFILAQPNGLSTLLGEHGGNLSGGQKQRLSIARAILRKPKLIIFDEATSALDSSSERKIQSAIEAMKKDCTVFMVAHRLSTIKNADRICVIGNGKLLESGTYDELMQKEGVFYQLRQLQS